MLQRLGAHVLSDGSTPISHNKVVIIDGAEALGGSANLSEDDLTRNAENVLILRVPETIQTFAASFDARARDVKTRVFRYHGSQPVKRR